MKKIICALLAATFLSAGVISGCSSGEAQPTAQSSDSSSSQSSAESSKEESSKEESSNQGVDVAVTSLMKPKAELLASLSADNLSNIGGFIGINQGFFYYTGSSRYDENAKYGVLNSDTNKIENAEYSYMQEASYQDSNNHKLGYYSCTKAKSTKTISDMNSFGLVSTSGKELYDINAKKVYDGDIKYCSYNKQFDIYKITDHDGVITYLDKDAKVIAALPDDSNLITDETNGVAYVKGQSNPYSVYCFADKKPSITSKDSPKDCAPFSFDNGSGVISALDNSTLIDENYTSIISNGNGLVIAKKTDGSADFYKITIA